MLDKLDYRLYTASPEPAGIISIVDLFHGLIYNLNFLKIAPAMSLRLWQSKDFIKKHNK